MCFTHSPEKHKEDGDAVLCATLWGGTCVS